MIVSDFGKFCRKLRIDQDENLKEMAHKLGVTPSYVSAIELGKRPIPAGWDQKIADLYPLSAGQLGQLATMITLGELTAKEKKALADAMTVLYLNDNSDYINGLWAVVRTIVGDAVIDNDGFHLKDWLDMMKTFD